MNVYKHTPVFWLTTFGTVLRNHNYDTSPNRMMNDSIDFIYNKRITNIESVENRRDLLSTWTGHIGSKDYTNELGLDPRIEPIIPWDLQDKVSGVQLYTLYGKSWLVDSFTIRTHMTKTQSRGVYGYITDERTYGTL